MAFNICEINLPCDTLRIIVSYLTLEERYGLRKGFLKLLIRQLFYPRDYNGVVERPISYFYKTTKRKRCFREVNEDFYVLRYCRSRFKYFLRFSNEVDNTYYKLRARLEVLPNYCGYNDALSVRQLFSTLPLDGTLITQNRYIAVCDWLVNIPFGYYNEEQFTTGKVEMVRTICNFCLELENRKATACTNK